MRARGREGARREGVVKVLEEDDGGRHGRGHRRPAGVPPPAPRPPSPNPAPPAAAPRRTPPVQAPHTRAQCGESAAPERTQTCAGLQANDMRCCRGRRLDAAARRTAASRSCSSTIQVRMCGHVRAYVRARSCTCVRVCIFLRVCGCAWVCAPYSTRERRGGGREGGREGEKEGGREGGISIKYKIVYEWK